MSTSSVNSVTGTSAAYTDLSQATTSTATRTVKSTLDSSDFLQLLATQMQNQDPNNPMDDKDFMAQMAQFSALDQTQTLVSQVKQLRADQQQLSAATMIGAQVTVTGTDGNSVTGRVDAVDSSSGSPQLVVNGTSYSLSSVVRVEPYTVTDTPTNSSPVTTDPTPVTTPTTGTQNSE